MRKTVKILSLMLVVVVFLCSCSNGKPANISEDGASSDLQKNGGTIKMGTVPVDTLNPLMTAHSSVADFLSLVYEGLFVTMPDLSVKPVLASEYVASGDNTIYTIKLKGGVKFHSGKVFSSEDVIATLSYILAYGGKYTSVTDAIATYEAPSADTVVITLKSPVADFVNVLDFPVLPSGLEFDAFSVPSPDFLPIGTGMYTYDGISEHKNIYLKANKSWHDSSKRAHIDKIDIEILSDEETVISAFDAGTTDIFADSWKNPAELNLTADRYNIFETPQNRFTFLGLNTAASAFDTKEERADFVSVINRDKLCEDIMLGRATAAYFPVRDDVYFDEETTEEEKDDKKTAAQNTESNSEEKPSELILLYNSDSKTKKRLALAIKQQLDIAGYNTTLNPQPFDAYLLKVANCEYDLYLGEVNIDNASNLEFMFGALRSGENVCSFVTPELATLVSNLNRMSGKENRVVALENFKKYYTENAFQVSLYFTKGGVYVSKRVSGSLTPNLSNLYYGFENLYFEEKD